MVTCSEGGTVMGSLKWQYLEHTAAVNLIQDFDETYNDINVWLPLGINSPKYSWQLDTLQT